jgi:hypothetical protein
LRSQCETSISSQGLFGADWTGNRLDLLSHQQISVGDLPKWYKDLPINQQVHDACTEPGCKLLLDSFIIKPQQNIAMEANIFDSPMIFKMTHLIKNATIQNLERVMSKLDKKCQPEKRHLRELKQWLDNESSEQNKTFVHYGISIGSIMISGLILFVLMYLFYRYKSGNKN